MKREKMFFFGFIIIMVLTMTGFTLSPPPVEFPPEFWGTWQRLDQSVASSTRTITANTFTNSSQQSYWILTKVSKDSYSLRNSNNPQIKPRYIMKIVGGNLVISGCTGSGQSDCNGVWTKI